MIKSYNPNNSISSPDKLDEDKSNENSLRPSRFSEFTGQQDIIKNLKVYIEAAKQRQDALDHVLLALGNEGIFKCFEREITSF